MTLSLSELEERKLRTPSQILHAFKSITVFPSCDIFKLLIEDWRVLGHLD